MKAYIGTKIIKANPMTEVEFKIMQGRPVIEGAAEDRPGYEVVYPDGYVSWSPKETFEEAYREVTTKELAMLAL